MSRLAALLMVLCVGGDPSDDITAAPPLTRPERASASPSYDDISSDVTMTSQHLPLIFEPADDVTVAMMMTASGDSEPERAVETSRVTLRPSQHPTRHSGKSQGDDITAIATVSEELDSEESDKEEDDDETDSESEEDPVESTVVAAPPVWLQRNRGLVRSWVQLVRDKAGNVSGMLAPVGVGLAVALVVGVALYGIRAVHRTWRERRTLQQRKSVREARIGPDNTLLLDSSEDEF